ncbi:MAG: hypothetical protein DMG15_12420 [Acidobacteria bacterium]|nr:MAG: hypothetical protein DMG15_12420 [Acidobacteriota bacterium]
MTIFGKRLGEYVEFCKPFLVLVPIAGIVRLAVSLGGAPNSTAKWISVTALVGIGVLYYSVRVHTSGFGGYKQLLVISVLLNLAAQVVIIFGIVLAIVTGTPNIYSAPEYAFGSDGATWSHAAAHLFIGTTAGSLGPWIIGSVVLFITKKVSRADSKIKSLA